MLQKNVHLIYIHTAFIKNIKPCNASQNTCNYLRNLTQKEVNIITKRDGKESDKVPKRLAVAGKQTKQKCIYASL